MEPISPELVMIDPELAHLERSRLTVTPVLRRPLRALDDAPAQHQWQGSPRHRCQRFADFVAGAAWAGVAVGIALFIQGLHG